jgi:hypothetical protein
MLKKIGDLCRALYILLAVIAGFVALGMMDVALVLVVLGLISGLSMPRDRMVLAGVTALALPIVGGALAHIPTIGDKLAAVCGNLQTGVAAALATALAMKLYELVVEGVMGLTGGAAAGGTAARA